MAKPNITEVGRVTVPSADQDRSLAFYTETLGFETRVDETFADGKMRWIEVAPAGATTGDRPDAADGRLPAGPADRDHRLDRRHRGHHAALKDAGADIDPESPAHGRSRAADVRGSRPGGQRADDRRADRGLVEGTASAAGRRDVVVEAKQVSGRTHA
jgi:catechol 2,3-dioxygenase-like lactoylglutathione lyase family enzyme